MEENLCYLSLGSNIGDRFKNLAQARDLISVQCKILALSSVYETSPVGYQNQGDFYNACIKCRAMLAPAALYKFFKSLEDKMGRKRLRANGPRIIDIDLLFYSTYVLKQPELVIPHPSYHKRLFVLKPLLEISPGLKDPATGEKAAHYLQNEFPGQQVKRIAAFPD